MKKFVTVTPVRINDWIVQASVMDNDSICMIVYHTNNLRCFIRFFDDEEKANVFVRSIICRDQGVSFPDK